MTIEQSAWIFLAIFSVPISYQDIKTQTLPNWMSIGFTLAALFMAIFGWANGDIEIGIALLGGFIALVFYLILYAISMGSFGAADVKLAPGFGILLASISLSSVSIWLLASSLLSGLIALTLLASKKLGMKDSFAFAPAMFIGAFITLLMR